MFRICPHALQGKSARLEISARPPYKAVRYLAGAIFLQRFPGYYMLRGLMTVVRETVRLFLSMFTQGRYRL